MQTPEPDGSTSVEKSPRKNKFSGPTWVHGGSGSMPADPVKESLTGSAITKQNLPFFKLAASLYGRREKRNTLT